MGMGLENLLAEKRSVILEAWVGRILETYPAETAQFLRSKKNRFANPVGAALSEGTEGLFDELLRGFDREKVSPFLDRIIRIRAIQDFTPSQALAFVFSLKSVIRTELAEQAQESAAELAELESRIDALALVAFDIFMECREKIYEIRADEHKRLTYNLLRRAKLICELEPEQDPVDDNNR